MKDLLTLLCSRGPAFGYFPQPSKCFVVVAPSFVDQAKNIFGCLGVQVVTGHHFLGGYIGDMELRQDFVLQKVHQWSCHIRTPSAFAYKLLILQLLGPYSLNGTLLCVLILVVVQ